MTTEEQHLLNDLRHFINKSDSYDPDIFFYENGQPGNVLGHFIKMLDSSISHILHDLSMKRIEIFKDKFNYFMFSIHDKNDISFIITNMMLKYLLEKGKNKISLMDLDFLIYIISEKMEKDKLLDIMDRHIQKPVFHGSGNIRMINESRNKVSGLSLFKYYTSNCNYNIHEKSMSRHMFSNLMYIIENPFKINTLSFSQDFDKTNYDILNVSYDINPEAFEEQILIRRQIDKNTNNTVDNDMDIEQLYMLLEKDIFDQFFDLDVQDKDMRLKVANRFNDIFTLV